MCPVSAQQLSVCWPLAYAMHTVISLAHAMDAVILLAHAMYVCMYECMYQHALRVYNSFNKVPLHGLAVTLAVTLSRTPVTPQPWPMVRDPPRP